jgi:hypothetical protein
MMTAIITTLTTTARRMKLIPMPLCVSMFRR